MSKVQSNQVFDSLLNGLATIIQYRLDQYFDPDTKTVDPGFHIGNPFGAYLPECSPEETIVLLIALIPHINPVFFDQIIQQTLPQAGDFPQLGGMRGKQFRGFLPTGETALFILAGNNLERKFANQHLFSEDHFFAKKRILWLEDAPAGEPVMSGRIVMSPEYVDLFTIGKISKPKFGMRFPAQLIETRLEWDDLVLNEQTMQQIKDLENWINHGNTLLYDWDMVGRIKPGYRVLFCGPPGTGKTLAATLLGKYTRKDVYRIDLSMVVSKFIGETEKNLSNLFANAENHDWILFFDEADALFGKRTNVRDAHDKYANQEVSYLLQRVETYKGLVILASNFRDNIDEAFIRRFQSIVYFPKPKPEERLKIWQKAFPPNIQLHPATELEAVARAYELTGANIVNVVQQLCLQALASKNLMIGGKELKEGIRKEFAKEGKML